MGDRLFGLLWPCLTICLRTDMGEGNTQPVSSAQEVWGERATGLLPMLAVLLYKSSLICYTICPPQNLGEVILHLICFWLYSIYSPGFRSLKNKINNTGINFISEPKHGSRGVLPYCKKTSYSISSVATLPPPPAPLRVPELSRIKDRVLKQEDFTGTSSWQGLACSWPGGCLFVEAAAWGKARVCAAETLSTSVITKRILDWEKECQNIEATSSLNSNI